MTEFNTKTDEEDLQPVFVSATFRGQMDIQNYKGKLEMSSTFNDRAMFSLFK